MNRFLDQSVYNKISSIVMMLVTISVMFGILLVIEHIVSLFLPWSLLVLGFFLWWGTYSFSTAMNGGSTDIKSLLSGFKREFLCAIPVYGKRHRMKWAKELHTPSHIQTLDEIYDMIPGTLHFLIEHVLFLFGPILVWYFMQ